MIMFLMMVVVLDQQWRKHRKVTRQLTMEKMEWEKSLAVALSLW